MARCKGIKLGRKLASLLKWRTRRAAAAYERLAPREEGPISRLCRWARSLRRREAKPRLPEVRLGGEEPPKGHLAVYVGEKEGSFSRVVVPVLYFNHPLFMSLLREAEKEYGFDHPGGIQIPCPVSELERVRVKIDGAARRRLLHHRELLL